MTDIEILIDYLRKKEKMAAMLAPSFPISFEYPQIVGKLKRLGFSYVVEVTVGATWTNAGVVEALKKNPDSRFITAPCPSVVRMIRTSYPQLLKYLALQVDSPMAATARRLDETGLGLKKVFVGPCIAKKFEAAEDRKELSILVLTYEEMKMVFEKMGIEDDENDKKSDFDWKMEKTRLYPISGGLAQSAGLKTMLAEDEIGVVSGWKNCREALEKFENSNIRLLDILFCDGGCVNGPGIVNSLSLDERRKKIVRYWEDYAIRE